MRMSTTNQPKKGDILPCGGIVTYVGRRAYEFRDTKGNRRTVEFAPISAQEMAEMNASAMVRVAAEKAAEKELDRQATPEEIAAHFAAVAANRAATIARCQPIEAAALAAVPDSDRAAWLANLADLNSRYRNAAIECATVYGCGSGHTVRDRVSGKWAWDTSVVTYDGGGSGYGRHTD